MTPFTSSRFLLRKVSTGNEGTSVNLWFLGEKTSNALQDLGAPLIIPETALLAFSHAGAPKIFCIERDDGTTYVHVTNGGLVRSMPARPNGIDLQNFRRIIGFMARDSEALTVHKNEYFPLILHVLRNLSLNSLLDFVNLEFVRHALKDKRLKMTAAIACALFLAYMALAAFTPFFAERWLRQQNTRLTQDLAAVLEKRTSIDALLARQRLLAGKVNSYTYKLPIMNLLNDALPQQTTIIQLTVSGNTVEVRGTTPKASELLGALAQTPGVKNARFTSPLAEDPSTKLETFTLSFTYAQD
jgi:Tfp pilus assembly protein PilN